MSTAICIFHSQLLPDKFRADSYMIQTLLEGPGEVDYGNYGAFATIALFYKFLGLSHEPLLAGLLGILIGQTVMVVAIYLCYPVRATWYSVGIIFLFGILNGVFQGVYAKEVIISLLMIVFLLLPTGLLWDLVLVVLMVGCAHYFRPYWYLIAAVFLGMRIFITRKPSMKMFLLALLCCSIVLSLAIVATGHPADYYRTVVNVNRGAETGSLITRFVGGPEPISGIVNVLITTVFLLYPVTLLLKLSPYYVVISLIIGFVWTSYFGSLHRWFQQEDIPPLVARCICLIGAFACVQGIFEPDYGSALRHITPFFPMFLFLSVFVARSQRPAREALGERNSET